MIFSRKIHVFCRIFRFLRSFCMIPLNEQAYKHLQKLILENQLSYHEIYSETKLSKEIGISRTPFRDAIHRLAQEGYIDIIQTRDLCCISLPNRMSTKLFRSALHWKATARFRSVRILSAEKHEDCSKNFI